MSFLTIRTMTKSFGTMEQYASGLKSKEFTSDGHFTYVASKAVQLNINKAFSILDTKRNHLSEVSLRVIDGFNMVKSAIQGLVDQKTSLEKMAGLLDEAALEETGSERREKIQLAIAEIFSEMKTRADELKHEDTFVLKNGNRSISIPTGSDTDRPIVFNLVPATLNSLGLDDIKVDTVENSKKAIAQFFKADDLLTNGMKKLAEPGNALLKESKSLEIRLSTILYSQEMINPQAAAELASRIKPSQLSKAHNINSFLLSQVQNFLMS